MTAASLPHRWRRYPKYKPSGVEWLGEVPEGWAITKLGYGASVKARLGWKGLKADEYQKEGYIFLSTPNIKSNTVDFINVNYISQYRYFESPEIMLQKGDVIIAKDGSTLGITNVIRDLPAPATVNSSIAVIRPNTGITSLFLYYLLSSNFTQNTIQRLKGGQGVPHLFQEDLRKFWIWLPLRSEQTSIAAFLDRETARIDALIEKKERQIDLLKEKRAALISHAVTKGLDPLVPMKDSGVEWLGMVPEGWDISKLKWNVSKIGSGKTPRGGAEIYQDAGILFIRSQNVHFDGLVLNDIAFISPEIDAEMETSRVIPLDILLNITGASLGRCTIVPEIIPYANVNQHVCIVRPTKEKVLPDYLNRYLSSSIAQWQIFRSEEGVSREGLTFSQVGNIVVLIPPLKEQKEISDFLNIECIRNNTIIEKIQVSIDKLHEYRSALISSAVTGKIDVRQEGIA